MESSRLSDRVRKNDASSGGLNVVEPDVIKKLQDGQLFGHTGLLKILSFKMAIYEFIYHLNAYADLLGTE